MEKRSCFQCRFYNPRTYVCMYECRIRAILNETDSAKDCNDFSEGKYSRYKLEKSNYR